MTESRTPRSIVAVTAHSGDFVWRAGGALALSAARGDAVRVICLSFGERGESQGLWSRPGMDMETVKRVRREEAEAAAAALGVRVDFYDLGDYPLTVADGDRDRIVAALREARPDVLLTHVANDPYNLDHDTAHATALRTRMIAQAMGHDPAGTPIGATQVLMFEPHQPEVCGFTPNLLLDVTPVFDRKRKAMEVMSAQGHLIEYYTELGRRRGVQARRNGAPAGVVQAEAFQRVFPVVGDELI
ncbi:GlcNAc-PI de-N-acetylase [Acrocarpospora phusangensis]|uniref:GlcNAc-PI de-N-acetylase n=1 Tax=Acrocarpospora phusangensis TaxID=1070424 RepID=A0A919Q7Z3_9ACTN|nr:PIG-L deacetylase family protein [Acrocarpospora phusangensis]GIH23992.1 GlcNAc-PI de-N-acetylase [Acrocarpospora phusangensis]